MNATVGTWGVDDLCNGSLIILSVDNGGLST